MKTLFREFYLWAAEGVAYKLIEWGTRLIPDPAERGRVWLYLKIHFERKLKNWQD